jgi:hypothetical protein
MTEEITNPDLAYFRFEEPDLLKQIWDELNKDHIFDHKEKLFLFLAYCSSLLHPDYRISVALVGDSSTGKDNINKAVIKHFPENLVLDCSRITGPALEDDIQNYKAVYIGEGNFQREDGSNKPILEYIKSLAENGTRVLKKDLRTGNKELRDDGKQDRKTMVFSTTDTGHNEELATRFCLLSIDGYPAKTGAINRSVSKIAADYHLEMDTRERSINPSWIKMGISKLKIPEFISIPYAERMFVSDKNPRSTRDYKRFLNLIRALAFIHQRNRYWEIMDGHHVLFASPEDFYNAFAIAEDIFSRSYSQIEKRLQAVIDTMKKLERDGRSEKLPDGNYVDRADIQESLGIGHRNTVSKRMKALSELGLVSYTNTGLPEKSGKRSLWKLSVQSSVHEALLNVQKDRAFEEITKIYDEKVNGSERLMNALLNASKIQKSICIDIPDDKNTPNVHSFRGGTPKGQNSRLGRFFGENEHLKVNVSLVADYCKEPVHIDAVKSTFGLTDSDIEYLTKEGILFETTPGMVKNACC